MNNLPVESDVQGSSRGGGDKISIARQTQPAFKGGKYLDTLLAQCRRVPSFTAQYILELD